MALPQPTRPAYARGVVKGATRQVQDQLLRVLGVLVGAAGVYLFAEGQRMVGVLAVVLGTLGILMTMHPAFRLSSEPKPSGGSLMGNRKADAARQRGEKRMREAAERGPGGRRGRPSS